MRRVLAFPRCRCQLFLFAPSRSILSFHPFSLSGRRKRENCPSDNGSFINKRKKEKRKKKKKKKRAKQTKGMESGGRVESSGLKRNEMVGRRVTRGFKEAAEIYTRADRSPPPALTIRDASALTALRQQARVVETYNEKIMNPVHQVCLECEPRSTTLASSSCPVSLPRSFHRFPV